MTRKQKIIFLCVAAFIVFVLISFWIYKYHFEFKNDEVQKLIDEEAANFKPNQEPVKKILKESVEHILGERDLIQMVNIQSKSTGIPKEKILVDAAIGLAQSQKYIT